MAQIVCSSGNFSSIPTKTAGDSILTHMKSSTLPLVATVVFLDDIVLLMMQLFNSLYLMVLSADNLCKQFGPRNVGPDLDLNCLTL